MRRQFWRAAIAVRSRLWSAYVRWLRWRGPHVAARAAMHCAPLLRVRILRALGAQVGEGTCIHEPFVLMNAVGDFSHLCIGADCYLGPDLVVDLTEPVSIGDRAAIGAGSRILTHFNVGLSRLRAVYPFDSGEVRIGSDAYVGAGVLLLHGVAIGDAALVAAGSVVRHSVPPATVVAGVPARSVKTVELP